MRQTWLVTGGSGFVGRHILHLLEQIDADKPNVFALGRRHPGGWPLENFLRADLDDQEGLCRKIAALQPDVVIHAAGQTPPAPASRLYLGNTRCTANLLGAIRKLAKPTRVVLVGSAAELGPVPVEDLPVAEDRPCRPIDAYGLSKWAATRMGLAEPAPLEVVVARVFNPIGPGLPISQAFGRFASVLAEPGPDPLRLFVGNLEARRDFVDVRDVASALVLLALRGSPGSITNIGTGNSHAIGDGLEVLVQSSGRNVRIDSDSSLRGWMDSRADVSKLRELGWKPIISFEQSLADLWDEVRRSSSSRRVA